MGNPITADLVEAVADAENAEPTNLDYKLQEYIPVDAIEQLANHESSSWKLSFELPEQHVTVTSDGLILVNGKRKAVWT